MGRSSDWLFRTLAIVTLLSLFAGIATELYVLAGIPVFLLLAYMCLVDFRKVFFLLLACIPLSTEIYLPNGLATDLPTEPLMVGLMLVYLVYVLVNSRRLNSGFIKHPVTLLVLLHLVWILITTVSSQLFVVSLKFSLAKTWYIVVFYFMAGSILKEVKDVKILFWIIFIPLVLTILYVWSRHAPYGFSFKKVSGVLDPFYRNHVNYASLLALFFPFIWFARGWYRTWSIRWWGLGLSLVFFLLAIQFSYTRAAYVALILALGAYFVIQFRLMKYVLGLGLIIVIFGVMDMLSNNKYLEYAPNFEKTITHVEFDNLVEATYKGEDISTMERVYRWVAGMHMSIAEPFKGFGPGNFYNFYRSYTVSSFKTYVSDNPEKSGIHSYYLMTLVEQGFPGLIIFLLLCLVPLIKGEMIYHRTKDLDRKRIIMLLLLSMVIIDALLLINDMVETDKVGTFFFMNMAILVNMDLAAKREK
ncbi:MAG: O-antigen ligase family protein [Bacteroidota bacterium]